MTRSTGGMASPRLLLLVALSLLAACEAGPVGPLPNVTSAHLGFKEGGCAVGDVVYLPGDEFPGASACERCRCAGAGDVSCTRTRCEPRPGCKALHRPDHCCPTYQCECEQEGRVYGNGEKLVDPADPCRVCYCQGGEVVCRRIACFVRDDCTPRLVPGRCCPEYDNCPLRGVTTVSGVTPSLSTIEDAASSPVPSPPKENVKKEITIKEITPVSEIPIIPEVKVKEILPTPGIEVPNYFSSKSPLIVREATTENIMTSNVDSKTEKPAIIELSPLSSTQPINPSEVPSSSTYPSEGITDTKTKGDEPPSKISLSTQDTVKHDTHPSIATSIATMGVSSITPDLVPVPGTTKAPVMEEEDTSLFDHNPAFPPLPDDLSVRSNHDDELLPDQIDSEHVLTHETTSVAVEQHNVLTTKASVTPASTSLAPNDAVINLKTVPETTSEVIVVATESSLYTSTNHDFNTASIPNTADLSTAKLETTLSIGTTNVKDSPMLNLRSAIPTEILDIPSSVSEEIDGKLDDDVTKSSSVSTEIIPTETTITSKNVFDKVEQFTDEPKLPETATTTPAQQVTIQLNAGTSTKAHETSVYPTADQHPQEETANPEAKSSIVTEITAQTEFSSLPIETSDQKPKENTENMEKDMLATTANPSFVEFTTKVDTPAETEVITVSRSDPSNTDNFSAENVETTEFIINAFGSSESATDAVELIKISAEPENSAAIILPNNGKKTSVLTDLINLVGDVAAISNHTDSPEATRHATAAASSAVPILAGTTGISESEELIPVNAGYKSKNSNWNLNSITEIPIKTKGSPTVSKQKVVEIEDDEGESITDFPAPNDKVEPTTRRPIIDHVSDDVRPDNRTEKKDIEIITKSYVPTLNRRPTKVVMKKSNEQTVTEETSTETEVTTVPPVTTNVRAATAATVTAAATAVGGEGAATGAATAPSAETATATDPPAAPVTSTH